MDNDRPGSPAGGDGEMFRVLAEHVRDYAVFMLDAEGRVQSWTRSAERLLGYSEEEIVGRASEVLFTPEDQAQGILAAALKESLASGAGELDRWLVRKDGTRLWASGTITPLPEESGGNRGFATIVRDRTQWKQDELVRREALRQSEERFRGLMEQAPFSIQIFAHDGQTVRVNRAWEELWGIAADQISDYNVLHDPQLAAKGAAGVIERAFAGEVVHVPAVYYDPNETVPDRTRHVEPRRWVTAVAYPLRDRDGHVREVILVHEDITARKLAEDALRESEERFRGIVSHSVAGVAEVDLSGKFLFVNDRYCEIVARTREQLLAMKMQDISHDGELRTNLVLFDRIGRDGRSYSIEKRYLRPDGSEIWVNNSVSGLRDSEGRVQSIVAVCVDINERKRTEQDLRFLADASRSLSTLIDPRSTMQRIASMAVPHFADWCGIEFADRDASGGEELQQLALAHADPDKVHAAAELRKRWPPNPAARGGIYHVFRSGESVLVEEFTEEMLRASTESGEHFEAVRSLGLKSYMCVPLVVRERTIGVMTFAAAESMRRFTTSDLAVAEDLARRAAIAIDNAHLYATLQEEGRKKDEFLAMLAHELRNPLAPIRSGLDLLAMMDVEREVLEMMQQQVEHMVRLVDDLLDVSRIMRGKVELRRESTELSSIINRAIDSVRPLIDKHHQNLTRSLPAEPVWIDADPVRMAQVIGNLLNNASKYTEPGGDIELSVERRDASVLLRVRDSGIGIRRELLPHVFDLFTQDQRTIDRSQGGLGIGLTVAKSLVELHGGTIAANSEGTSRGSEFAVRLPTIPPPQSHAGSESHPADAPPLKILIVDDNVAAAKMLALLLTRIGEHRVTLAHDGVAAVATARDVRPDLVLLDIGLPRLDGFEVARQLRQDPSLHHLYLVALTGYGTERDRRKSLEAGFDEHLVKPPRLESLQALLAHARPGG
ncbi:PAS domain S-box protein [Candidatus Laterigemmans baculatus]|uniref:PAS domain S-box protein n=1 Tax=Candidatus Laterigemmans baculatus TaxID=2770505 RepID=UPI0013DD3312|nr:PAS domain S-box protein [Candidatus Laterigemmans baculatus]